MFKSILFLNGTLPNVSRWNDLNGVCLIAADGGALQKLRLQGMSPHVVVGDGDTLKEVERSSSLNIFIDDDQETTDFEKCLAYIKGNNLSPTLVCGIGGGEIDHQHNNLHTFVKYSSTLRMLFLDEQVGVKPKVGFTVHKSLSLETPIGTTVSLLPLPEARIVTQGLQWPLKNELLSLLGRSGARNSSCKERVHVEISEGGPLLVVLDALSVRSASVDGWDVSFNLTSCEWVH